MARMEKGRHAAAASTARERVRVCLRASAACFREAASPPRRRRLATVASVHGARIRLPPGSPPRRRPSPPANARDEGTAPSLVTTTLGVGRRSRACTSRGAAGVAAAPRRARLRGSRCRIAAAAPRPSERGGWGPELPLLSLLGLRGLRRALRGVRVLRRVAGRLRRVPAPSSAALALGASLGGVAAAVGVGVVVAVLVALRGEAGVRGARRRVLREAGEVDAALVACGVVPRLRAVARASVPARRVAALRVEAAALRAVPEREAREALRAVRVGALRLGALRAVAVRALRAVPAASAAPAAAAKAGQGRAVPEALRGEGADVSGEEAVRGAVGARARKGDVGAAECGERALHEKLRLLEVGEEGVPQLLLGEDLWVAQHDQAVPRAREGDVEAARVGEEADALRLVRADAREDDEVLLAPLEGVYRGDLHLRVQLLRQGAVALHRRDDVGALPIVRRDDADLRGGDARREEARDRLLDLGRLGAVEVGGSRARHLLGAEAAVEDHRARRVGPGEAALERRALGGGDAVLEGALVKRV
mmetsp:Transcript_20151/g.59677  ORF Transcript_20151/g.59677 Transcript_20151/m.59677 type:complete len:538 (-) Transcript_20151:1838-3451(-)